MYANVFLKPEKEKSLMKFHRWVFSGAIARTESKLNDGDLVYVNDSRGKFLATGYFQDGSIAVRVLSFEQCNINTDFWVKQLQQAFALRQSLGLTGSSNTNCYRLVNAEADGMSGLIVDIYNQTAVIQIHTKGIYRWRNQITEALQTVLGSQLTAVYDKSSATIPDTIKHSDGYLLGNPSARGEIIENGNKFVVDWAEGQKTGFFLDQRDNRELLSRYTANKKVLNVFGYTGGFSVYALRGGASFVETIDASKKAIELATSNVHLNFGNEAPHNAMVADAFEYLEKMPTDFDVVVLDPPAFAKHSAQVEKALKGYKNINAQAMKNIKRGGILFTFSCSQQVSTQDFLRAIFNASMAAERRIKILHHLFQAPDHTVDICHPENEYLKGLVLCVE